MRKILITLVLVTSSLQAQITTSYTETPLDLILTEISKSHNLIFSFSNELVKNKIISLSTQNASLDEVIKRLTSLTKLNFKKISDRQVIVSAPVHTAEVCGYLRDASTGAPLPYANIIIQETDTGGIANEDGYFQLGHFNIDKTIKIQFVGYKDMIVSVTDFKRTPCPKISLYQESTALETVLIVEYITKGVGKNIDGSLHIANENLGILPGQTEADVLQTIQMIPGINSPDESASGIQIRGGSTDQNLVLWDDIRMYNTGHLFGMISAFNPNVINDAKIIKGGADPQYGDRLSGVIDITSDTSIPKHLQGGTGVNGTHADFFIKAPIGKKIGIIASGRRSYTDFISTSNYESLIQKVVQNTKIVETATQPNPDPGDDDDEIEEEVRDKNFFFYDASLKLIADITPTDKIMASTIYTTNDLAFEIADDEDLLTDDLTITNEGASFSWQGSKRKQWRYRLKGFYSKFDSNYQFTQQQESVVEEQSIRRNTVEEIGADAHITYDFSKQHATTFGYQFTNNEVLYTITRQSEFDSPINETDQVKNTAHTLYANYTFHPRNKGFINLGIRTSHYAIVDRVYLEPRINIEYPIIKDIRIKATGELRYQPITQLIEFEDTQLRIENNLWVHSDNDDIPVLESIQFSTGLLYTINDWNLEVDGYYKNIKGLTSLTNGFNNIETDLSTGESKIMGIDVLLKKQFKNFRTWIGYTFNDIEYTFPEIQEASFPGNNDIRHNFRISNTLELDKWEFSLGWLWRSGAPFTDADLVNEEIEFDSPNAERLPQFHRLDASVLYTFNVSKKGKWKSQLGVSFLNIYNRQVPLSISYTADENPDTDEVELDVLRQQSLGFTPNVTFRMWF